MKQVLSIALAICSFASAQNFYAREWTQNGFLDVNNDGVTDFVTSSEYVSPSHNDALLGVYTANIDKIKYLRFNESVGPNNTQSAWNGGVDQFGGGTIYRYDANALSISETQNRTYPLTGENYYFVAYNTSHNVVYPFKVGNRYGFFIFTKNIAGGYNVKYSVITTVDGATISVDPNTWNTTLGIDQNESPEFITIQQNGQQLELNTTTPIKSLELIDLTGKCVAMQLHSTHIPSSGLKKGIYLLRVIDEKNRTYTQKVLLH